jgi:hypothetical protein
MALSSVQTTPWIPQRPTLTASDKINRSNMRIYNENVRRQTLAAEKENGATYQPLGTPVRLNEGNTPTVSQPVLGITPASSSSFFTSQYGPIIDEARQAATTQSLALNQAQAQRESVAQQYGAREQNLTDFLGGLQQEEQGRLQARQQTLQGGVDSDLIQRGLYNQGTQTAVQGGIAATGSQLNDLMRERQTREQMNYRSALSGETLAAREAAVKGQFGTAAQALEMRQLPVSVGLQGAELDAAIRDAQRKTGVGRAQLQGQQATAEAQIRSSTTQQNADLALQRLGLQQSTALDYLGLQQSMSEAKAASQAAIYAMATKPIGVSIGTMSPNQPSWADISRGSLSGTYGTPWANQDYSKIVSQGYL